MSTGSGLSSWRRAKASIRWVSAAPRCAPCIALSIRAGSCRVVRQALAHQFEAAEHRRQEVVEVVRDAAGQLADRLHLLRLKQRFPGLFEGQLRLPPLGDVAGDLGEADELADLVADGDR